MKSTLENVHEFIFCKFTISHCENNKVKIYSKIETKDPRKVKRDYTSITSRNKCLVKD